MEKKRQLKWWQIALLAVAVSFLGKLSTGQKNNGETKIYEKELQQAPWAPPGWLFGPAWTLNNFFLLIGLQILLQRRDLPAYKKLLVLQAFIWIIFFSFGYVYFNKKSPILAAIWTIMDTALAAASFVISRRQNRKLAYTYLPLLIWTAFASSIAVYQAVQNPDPIVKL